MTAELPRTIHHSFTVSTDPSLAASAEFRIGLSSFPLLADHGFQDIVVLPGSFYVEMALSVHNRLFERLPSIVRNVAFQNLIILSEEDTVIKVEVRCTARGPVEYTFYEASGKDGSTGAAVGQFAARLEVDRDQSPPQSVEIDAFTIETLQAQSRTVIDSERFYSQLREGGNQYGAHFQNVSTIWLAGDQSLARLSVATQHGGIQPNHWNPILLDAITQLLAAFNIEKRKTFILRSIESIEVTDATFPDTLWGQAERLPRSASDTDGFVGNVRVFDQTGKLYLVFRGVSFTFLDRVGVADEKRQVSLQIAANFTAEPLEDALKFWGDHFGVPIHLEFAPYNQIYQQLLDTDSAFRKNRDGVNIILLRLEEWITEDRRRAMNLDTARAAYSFGNRASYALPNGLPVVHLKQYETDHLYKEIFDDQCYLRHGISLHDQATVIDIGANIGLFSLFVMSRCAAPTLYAFEPSPVVYQLLKANCDAYGTNVRTFNIGVSDKAKTGTFTSYENSSVFSGFHPDVSDDRDAIQAVVRNMLNSDMSLGSESVEEYVAELTADRLRGTTYECRLTCVSDIIRENHIDRIDLLKIDAEKSELDIVRGIEDRDWPKIAQIVIEIHDRTHEAVKQIRNLLIEKGFRCAVEQESLLEHSGFVHLYATRLDDLRSRDVVGAAVNHACKTRDCLERNIGDLSAAMRSFTSSAAAPLVLAFCPTSPAGEADAELKKSLDDAEQVLLSEAATIANVHTISSASPLRRYPVDDYYDPQSFKLGHIPYTAEYHAALGTSLFRAISSLRRTPYKVIVLDCDNTLWKGVCGEDGPAGVQITEPYRALQQFMTEQVTAGMLLCLCSRNNEADVRAVFDERLDMVLTQAHFVSRRINWKSKPDNIRSLAAELNLELDAFIFIDDNPVECADVRINCPSVLTLQLPHDTESIPSFLNHVWAFDHTRVTEEDHNRTRMYLEHVQRQKAREQTLSLADFIDGLQLRVTIDEPHADELNRVSQLTFRTNQFNFTTVRRSENEIREFLRRPHSKCLVVRASDRFGDYGLCGVVLYEAETDRYKVDTLLLSCRALGRGVEHSFLAGLGRRAVTEGHTLVELSYRPTAKNLPAFEFINSIAGRCRSEVSTPPLQHTLSGQASESSDGGSGSEASWTLSAEWLARLVFNADGRALAGHEKRAFDKPPSLPSQPLGLGVANLSERTQRAAENLRNIGQITQAIDEQRTRNELSLPVASAARGGTLEAAITNIWRRALGRHVGLNDNFFEVGGTSLRSVQVIAMIKKELKRDLSIVALFECPTVTLLAAKLRAISNPATGGTAIPAAALRGQQRRHKTMVRKSS